MTGFGCRRLAAAAALGAAVWALAMPPGALAEPPDIIIGAVYPLSGNAAPIGHDAQMALETEADIINGHDNIPMLLGQGGGLPRLGGAKIKLVFADSQNNPQIARTETERLITQELHECDRGYYQPDLQPLPDPLYFSRKFCSQPEPAGSCLVLPTLADRQRLLGRDVRFLPRNW